MFWIDENEFMNTYLREQMLTYLRAQ
jgi:hypothetical protein